jgi:hypothetical protein
LNRGECPKKLGAGSRPKKDSPTRRGCQKCAGFFHRPGQNFEVQKQNQFPDQTGGGVFCAREKCGGERIFHDGLTEEQIEKAERLMEELIALQGDEVMKSVLLGNVIEFYYYYLTELKNCYRENHHITLKRTP